MAQTRTDSGIVLFWEEGFPSEGVPALQQSNIESTFGNIRIANQNDLANALGTSRVLVVPYGSAFPESAWPAIKSFLEHGGNLVAIGGKPFTRPAFRDSEGRWQLRPETLAFARELRIYGYQPTPGSDQLSFAPNMDLAGLVLPPFAWKQSHSLVIRLSEVSLDSREGSTGSLDAHLTPLAWGVRNVTKLSAPAVEIDHIRNAFVGSRWDFLSCELPQDFWTAKASPALLQALLKTANDGAQEFTVRPVYAVFTEDEPWRFELNWTKPGAGPVPIQVELTFESDGRKLHKEKLQFVPSQIPFEIGFQITPLDATGLLRVTARLYVGGKLENIYHTGFWIRDEALLTLGPRVSVDTDYFVINGKRQPIVGTTYMASDVQRQYFELPNPYVWDRDMAEIEAAGLNMLRTGWWTGWDRLTENGVATEKTLRSLEAYLLTARSHHLPVQFTFFAFVPEVMGGANPYLDPVAISAQQKLIRSVVARFHEVPYVIWDLINEPSFANPKRTWITRPNGDDLELKTWNEWLLNRYGDIESVAAAWHSVPPITNVFPLPSDADFSGRGTMAGTLPAAAIDYHLFAQETFTTWARLMRQSIRDAGGHQLVTVGQDEGGVTDRPLPAFFAPAVDFTTNHTWWLNDALLWDSLAAKQPRMPLLIQETGIQHEAMPDGSPRLSDAEEGWLFERKLATALATSAGAIQWLWNTNGYMVPEMEITIGALRPDGTEKPEADVLRRFAQFAHATADLFGPPTEPDVVVLTSQALQLSPAGDLAVTAQQRAIRALQFDTHVTAGMLAENQLSKLGSPKLVILPSPQSLMESSWSELMLYVKNGGNLLVTGPVERDEHFALKPRLTALLPAAILGRLRTHYATFDSGSESAEIGFDYPAQQRLEALTIQQQGFYAAVPFGKGTIYLSSLPVELSDNRNATSALYRNVLQKVGIQPAYDAPALPRSIMVRAVSMPDAMLYLIVSEADQDADLSIKDRATGVVLNFNLPSQRARLAIIRKSDQSVFWSPE